MKFSPVGGDLNIKCHLDIKQVLVLTQVTGHLPLGALQFVVQLVDSLLQTQGGTSELITIIYLFIYLMLLILCIECRICSYNLSFFYSINMLFYVLFYLSLLCVVDLIMLTEFISIIWKPASLQQQEQTDSV